MTDHRRMARAFALGRVVLGLALLLVPGRMVRGMLGSPAEPGVALLARMLGVRDAIIGAGTLAALAEEDDAAVRPWATYGTAADAVDLVGMLVAYRGLPRGRRAAMVAMAAAGAGTGAYLTSRFSQAPAAPPLTA